MYCLISVHHPRFNINHAVDKNNTQQMQFDHLCKHETISEIWLTWPSVVDVVVRYLPVFVALTQIHTFLLIRHSRRVVTTADRKPALTRVKGELCYLLVILADAPFISRNWFLLPHNVQCPTTGYCAHFHGFLPRRCSHSYWGK